MKFGPYQNTGNYYLQDNTGFTKYRYKNPGNFIPGFLLIIWPI